MKVRVVAVSHRQPAWIDAGVAEYAGRLPRAWSFEVVELRPAPRDGGRTALQILNAEATRIAAATAGRRSVALDERGAALTTLRFAEKLARWRDAGTDVDFVIGSADGLAASVKTSAAAVVALSALTLPHGLARVLLVEQLYRAQSLLAGHPYHRAWRRMAPRFTMSAPLLYLASKSPRRHALLAQLGLEFETLRLREATGRPRDVVEETQDAEPPLHYVERIARTKAQVGWQRMQNRKLAERPVLGADTEVILDGDIFGKPRDADDAIRMLKRLSGRTHQVLTAIAVRYRDTTEVDVSVSRVTLRRLAAAEIERYTATGEPLDKAGGYAVQGRAAAFVSRIEGSYSGIVGLPLCETATLLARLGVSVL